jgi:hypothetical protein
MYTVHSRNCKQIKIIIIIIITYRSTSINVKFRLIAKFDVSVLLEVVTMKN